MRRGWTAAALAIAVCGVGGLFAQGPVRPVTYSVDGGVFGVPPSGERARLLPAVSVYVEVEDRISLTGYKILDSALTGGSGEYAFDEEFLSGDYRLRFRREGYQATFVLLKLARDTSIMVGLLPVGATGAIAGRVVEACVDLPCTRIRPPVPTCTVSVSVGRDFFQTLTDEDGYYTITSVPVYPPEREVVYTVRSAARGFEPQTSTDVSPVYDGVDSVHFALVPISSATRLVAGDGVQSFQVTYHEARNALRLVLPSEDVVHVEAYEAGGRRIRGLSSTYALGRGVHSIRLGNAWGASGVAVLRIAGTTGIRTLRVIGCGDAAR